MKHGLIHLMKRLGVQREKPQIEAVQDNGFDLPLWQETDKEMNELRVALLERIRVRSLM